MLKRLLLVGIAVFVGALAFVSSTRTADAAVLENAFLHVSDPRTAQTNVTHTFYFQVNVANLGSLQFQYCVNPSGTCTDSGADGQAAGALDDGNVTDGGAPAGTATFTDTWNDADWTWEVDFSAQEPTAAGNQWKVPFTGMGNPVLTNCTHGTPSNNSSGTCYVTIYAYPQTSYGGSADTAIVSLTVTQAVTVSARVDPVFTFTVTGVNGGETRNGTALTSDVNTSVTTVPFGNLTANTEEFAAHQLTVTTNTKAGYTVSVRVTTNLTGTAYGHDIDPFVGRSANQATPQSWTAPTGTVSSTNTGWLGVGTDDTGVSGQAANSFYMLNTTEFTIASSPNSATTRVTNVIYGIEVNSFQQADNYSGTLLYNAVPVY